MDFSRSGFQEPPPFKTVIVPSSPLNERFIATATPSDLKKFLLSLPEFLFLPDLLHEMILRSADKFSSIRTMNQAKEPWSTVKLRF